MTTEAERQKLCKWIEGWETGKFLWEISPKIKAFERKIAALAEETEGLLSADDEIDKFIADNIAIGILAFIDALEFEWANKKCTAIKISPGASSGDDPVNADWFECMECKILELKKLPDPFDEEDLHPYLKWDGLTTQADWRAKKQ